MCVSSKKCSRYHTMNWQTWQQLVKVDLVLSTEQSMHDLAASSTRNLMHRNLAIGIQKLFCSVGKSGMLSFDCYFKWILLWCFYQAASTINFKQKWNNVITNIERSLIKCSSLWLQYQASAIVVFFCCFMCLYILYEWK